MDIQEKGSLRSFKAFRELQEILLGLQANLKGFRRTQRWCQTDFKEFQGVSQKSQGKLKID